MSERFVGGPYNGAGREADGPYSHRRRWWMPPGHVEFRAKTQEEVARSRTLQARLKAGELTEWEAAVQESVLWRAHVVGGDPAQIERMFERRFGVSHFNADGSRFHPDQLEGRVLGVGVKRPERQ